MTDPWAGIDAAPRGDDRSDDRRCPWCSVEVGPEATKCPSCGASVAQRESIGGLVLPGVTSVDQAYDGSVSPLVRSTLRAQSTGAALAAVGQVNQTAELAVAGAVLARDYMKGMFAGVKRTDVSGVGRTSEAARLASEALDRGEPLDWDERPDVAIPIEPNTPNVPEGGEY